MPNSDTPIKLLARIELYLEKVGRALPSIRGDEFLEYVTPILREKSSKSDALRRAFDFPSKPNLRKGLLALLNSDEPSLMPLKSVCAQRIYHLLWRFKFTVEEIDAEWREDVLQRARALLLLSEPYLIAKRPTLLDIKGALDSKLDPKYFSESVSDTMLFAALRAFEYDEQKEPLAILDGQRQQFKKETLDFIFRYLSEVLTNRRRIDDSSNAWWAVRAGTEAGDDRFLPLIREMLERFPTVVIPSEEIRNRSAVPEIYTRLRTSAYTLSNIQAILETNIRLEAELKKQLDVMIEEMVRVLLDSPIDKNIYLASVHYEGLRNYLDHLEFKVIGEIVASGQLKLSDFTPIGKFVCADITLRDNLRDLRHWLLSPQSRGRRQSVLIYGPSSVGKSFLVEQLFEEGKQKAVFEKRHVVCSPGVDVVSRISEIASEITAATDAREIPPFIFLDEADAERKASFFPNLIDLLDKGSIKDGAPSLNEFVLFWGGGKYGSVDNLKKVLSKKQKEASLEKGIDVFNRAKFRINLSFDLLRNKNLKLLLGLAETLRYFGESRLLVDTSVFAWLRNAPLAFGQGVRQFGNIVRNFQKEDDLVFVPGISHTKTTVEVSN